MTTSEPPHSDHERRLDEAIASYLRLKAAGQTPERDEWLALYPDLAMDLAEFLDDVSHLKGALGIDSGQMRDGRLDSSQELRPQPGISIDGRIGRYRRLSNTQSRVLRGGVEVLLSSVGRAFCLPELQPADAPVRRLWFPRDQDLTRMNSRWKPSRWFWTVTRHRLFVIGLDCRIRIFCIAGSRSNSRRAALWPSTLTSFYFPMSYSFGIVDPTRMTGNKHGGLETSLTDALAPNKSTPMLGVHSHERRSQVLRRNESIVAAVRSQPFGGGDQP